MRIQSDLIKKDSGNSNPNVIVNKYYLQHEQNNNNNICNGRFQLNNVLNEAQVKL